jgi:hypothetical protein
MRESIGDEAYYKILGAHGYEHCNHITDRAIQTRIYKELEAHQKALQTTDPDTNDAQEPAE